MVYLNKIRSISTGLIIAIILLIDPSFIAAERPHEVRSANEHQEEIEEFYIDLDGEWYFFEEELLTPSETKERMQFGTGALVTLPSSFKDQTGNVNTFGTYSKMITVPKGYRDEALAVYVPYQYSAYRLFINENEIVSNGKVGEDQATHRAEMSPVLGYFFTSTGEVLVTIHVSSFDHIRGGLENAMYIGEASAVSQKFHTNIMITIFINGWIFIIGLFMILFVWYLRRKYIYLIFGAFCIFISLRSFFAEPFYYTLTSFEISWLWGTRLEYILTEASSLFYVILLWKWHQEEFSKRVLYGIGAVHIALIITTLFTKPVVFQALFFKVFYLAIPLFIYVVYVIYKSIRSGNRYAKVNMIGMALIFGAFFNDFAIGNNWYQSWTLMLPAVGLYVMLHVFLMSKEFAMMTRLKGELNSELVIQATTLDEKVHERTRLLEEANERLKRLVSIDSLTGINNRHSFNEFMENKFLHAAEQGTLLSLMMIDLDEFKKYNDYYGHIKGDHLLKDLVKLIASQLPENSLFARYGGEEFVVVLPQMANREAFEVAECVRKVVEESDIPHPRSKYGIVTISIGVATKSKEVQYETEMEFIDAADKQLYLSKGLGRNRVM